MSAILAACGDAGTESAGEVVIGSPSSPVTQPLFDDNVAIASGLEPEPGPLRVYNWADYINPDTILAAQDALGVEIELSTFFNEEEGDGSCSPPCRWEKRLWWWKRSAIGAWS
jgi:spermidine/putrescine transport system substrate-binding protein